jgi:adenosylmethionine-8-amino-7-oxononanoate aminotransferase
LKHNSFRLIVLGTDTDAGKSTFSLLWLAHFGSTWGYWKPFQTGLADSEKIRQAFPEVKIHPAIQHFAEAVAPALAAHNVGQIIPSVQAVVASQPEVTEPYLIETFGGPFSPLNDSELQIELVRALEYPSILVSSSAVGAIGRVVGQVKAMRSEAYSPRAIVLMGPHDPYAEREITKHLGIKVFSLPQPILWTSFEYRSLAQSSTATLDALHDHLFAVSFEQHTPSDLIQRDQKVVWHPYTSLRDAQPPLEVVSSHQEFLQLADGRKVIDAFSSWWTILHGHCYPPLMQTLREVSMNLDHVVFAGATHRYAVEVAERLLKQTRWPKQGRAFFSDNGSTAIEVALKLAYLCWSRRGEKQRSLFIGFENGYHGDTFGAMSISRDPIYFGEIEPMLLRAIQIPLCPNRLDETLKTKGSEVAGVVIEPLVQGAGGMQMHTPQTLQEIQNICRSHGVFFIADEIMTAFRTGEFWAHQAAVDVNPDLICLSKTLTGGVLPLAVTLASPEIVQYFDTPDRSKSFFHGHSFTGNPLACALAARNLELVDRGDWKKEVRRIQSVWNQFLPELQSHPAVREVRSLGTILAVEVHASGGYLAEVGPRFRTLALERGVFLRPLGNVLYAMPPLQTSQQSLEKIIYAIQGCLQTLE